jgi:hypothetical protein
MNTPKKINGTKDMQVKLSTLWVFVTFNYLYADVMALMDPEILGLLLGAAIFMEIPIAMIVLSRVLKYRANRWANIIAGTVKTVAILSSMFVGTAPALYYLFFGTIEIVCTSLIVWYAWKWSNPEGQPSQDSGRSR